MTEKSSYGAEETGGVPEGVDRGAFKGFGQHRVLGVNQFQLKDKKVRNK